MNILEQIDNDMKASLKNGDKITLELLRMIKNAIKMKSIDSKRDLEEDEVIGVLRSQVKQRKDSIEEYSKYNKEDVVSKLNNEIDLINKYLPEELSDEVINQKLDEIFDKVKPTSIKDMGTVMREAVSVFGSSVDKGHLSNMIKERLGSL